MYYYSVSTPFVEIIMRIGARIDLDTARQDIAPTRSTEMSAQAQQEEQGGALANALGSVKTRARTCSVR